MSFLEYLLNNFRFQFLKLIFIIFVDSIIAILSIISIAPVLDIIMNRSQIELNFITRFLIDFFGNDNIYFYISIFFIFNFLNGLIKIYIYRKTLIIKIHFFISLSLIGIISNLSKIVMF